MAGQGLETAQAAATAAAKTTAAGVGPGARDPTPSSTSGTAGVKTGNRQHGGKASGGASAGALASAAGSVCPSGATPAVPGDGTTVPGIRAASLAYALHVVTLALVRCDFPGWEAVWARQLEASFRLVGMIGECARGLDHHGLHGTLLGHMVLIGCANMLGNHAGG